MKSLLFCNSEASLLNPSVKTTCDIEPGIQQILNKKHLFNTLNYYDIYVAAVEFVLCYIVLSFVIRF